MFRFVCGVLSIGCFGFSYYLIKDISLPEIGGACVLIVAFVLAQASNEKG